MSINSVTLEGNLGADLEMRATPSGKEIGTTSLAVTTGYGERKQTSWYRIALFGNYATAMAQSMRKGVRVVVQGEISIREFQDNSGVKRTSVEIACRSVSAPSAQGQEARPQQTQAAPSQRSAPAVDDFDDSSVPF